MEHPNTPHDEQGTPQGMLNFEIVAKAELTNSCGILTPSSRFWDSDSMPFFLLLSQKNFKTKNPRWQ